MKDVSIYDARNRLSALIAEVERGGEVKITRRGKAVAKLVRAAPVNPAPAVVEGLLALRESIRDRTGSFSASDIRSLRDEGQR